MTLIRTPERCVCILNASQPILGGGALLLIIERTTSFRERLSRYNEPQNPLHHRRPQRLEYMRIFCWVCRKYFNKNGSITTKAIAYAKCKACLRKWNRIKKLSISERAETALKEAVHGVLLEHKRTGRPVVIWRNGKVAKVPASQLLRKRT